MRSERKRGGREMGGARRRKEEVMRRFWYRKTGGALNKPWQLISLLLIGSQSFAYLFISPPRNSLLMFYQEFECVDSPPETKGFSFTVRCSVEIRVVHFMSPSCALKTLSSLTGTGFYIRRRSWCVKTAAGRGKLWFDGLFGDSRIRSRLESTRGSVWELGKFHVTIYTTCQVNKEVADLSWTA